MMDDALEYYDNPIYTYTGFPNNSDYYVSEDISSHNISDNGSKESPFELERLILISILVICSLGIVGNGIVIWLLGFRIKRNPFTTYILNLAVFDFGLLMSSIFFIIVLECFSESYDHPSIIFALFMFFFLSFYSAGQFLLTAISIDRCVAVFFPLWHQCHRPPSLSAVICAVIWVVSILLTVIAFISVYSDEDPLRLFLLLIANSVLCLPLMTAATVALFTKVCFKAQQHRRGKLLTTILLTLLFFLILAFPSNVIMILINYADVPPDVENGSLALACFNSSVNPMIYFLVGRQRKARDRETMKMILQRAFKEEERCIEESH